MDTIMKLNIPTQSLQHHLKINAIDGGPIGNGTITVCANALLLQVSAVHQESISFPITTKHPIILGFHWMHLHDPEISWLNKEITK